MKGLELHSRSFLKLKKFCKKIEINVMTLESNVATLKEFENTSLCHVAKLGLNDATLAVHILEPSLLRRDVGLNVAMSDFNMLGNVVTLDFNVATLA